jgi:hypothetical protein
MLPPSTPQLRSPPRTLSVTKTDHQDYAERAIQTAVQMIQAAPMGTRHHTRRKAARLLGGYVAGGLLTEEGAYRVLKGALQGHTEDFDRALKTVEDGLTYGQAYPITREALAADRQRWHAQHHITHEGEPLRAVPLPSDPWAGTQTLPTRPYTGYGGLRYGKVVPDA